MTAVVKPSGGVPSAANGSRSTGRCPDRAANSAASAGMPSASSLAAARDQATAPVTEQMRGSSLTATAAAKPTPNRPTAASSGPDPRLAEARSVDRAATPAASSGAPVFAATSVPSLSVSRSRPPTLSRAAASAAFCASSTTTRSR